jgi:hypothetical protein
MEKKNSVIERLKKESAARIRNMGRESLSRQQKNAEAWVTSFLKDTK